ncbi:MAG: hypothetical protein IJ806_04640 [Ruminococcus sp.]|nr:hypothetical protein [Ruminococcus sp.]
MICPYCNKEMKKGILSGDGRSAVTWKEGDKKAGFYDKLGLAGYTVTAVRRTLAAFTVESYFCPECKKMIFDTDVK